MKNRKAYFSLTQFKTSKIQKSSRKLGALLRLYLKFLMTPASLTQIPQYIFFLFP